MDALMAALVAAALAQVGDRTAWLAAILSDRLRRPGLVIAMAALAILAASSVAAALGMVIGPKLAPNARQLLLALALLLQGGGAFFPAKMPERLDRWQIGAVATAFLGLFILAFGDGLQFIALALAARSPIPALAAIGVTLGSLVVIVPAAVMGETAWRRLPLKPLRIAIGALFLITGIVLALGALRLV
ncbi:TMEM165/GDT1 family protein [Sphingomonas sp. PB2P12]|uniref:TMEM165/GDT1 family protein n=1 Tax=Sphingomonas sandaracina TaxID=3096157 RepID=UPI002FC67691